VCELSTRTVKESKTFKDKRCLTECCGASMVQCDTTQLCVILKQARVLDIDKRNSLVQYFQLRYGLTPTLEVEHCKV
jgi:hypothetical protein